ncbi:MAG: calcium-binding protein [Solirubrobacteraceae bacterium]
MALALSALAPATALAGTASISGSSLNLLATPGQANDIVIIEAITSFQIADLGTGATLTPGSGCTAGAVNIVICPRAPVSSITVSTGDMDDKVANVTTYMSTLLGEAGDDRLSGGSGVDTLDGGSGSDVFDGGPGGDTFTGGSDPDYVTYSTRSTAVLADSDGVADDGASGENDNVGADVETLIGGSAADTLTGNALDNGLDGGPGADRLNGGPGNDYLLYWTRNAGVTVTFDGIANDGEAGENDIVGADVESAIGGNGADSLTGDAGPNTLLGANGNDTIMGAGGADALVGSSGIDFLDGGTEDDVLDGGDQADVMYGREGTDRATYAGRTNTVTVDLDDAADDGAPSEGDQVHSDIENLTGGSGADILTGSGAANVLDGAGGNDQLSGGAGDDTIQGGAGNDGLDGGSDADTLDGGIDADLLTGGAGVDSATYSDRAAPVTADFDGLADDGETGEGDTLSGDIENLTGGSGSDSLRGDATPNVVVGGPGRDTIDGGPGTDVLDAGPGEDSVSARDQTPDTVSCGTENDAVVSDPADTVAGDCEANDTGEVAAGPPPADPPPADPPPAKAPAADRIKTKISGAPVTVGADGVARILVSCPSGRSSRCRGTVTLNLLPTAKNPQAGATRRSRRRPASGKAKFSKASGKTAPVKVTLSRNGRRRLLRKRKLRVSVNVALDVGQGKQVITKKTITIKAARRSRRR